MHAYDYLYFIHKKFGCYGQNKFPIDYFPFKQTNKGVVLYNTIISDYIKKKNHFYTNAIIAQK